MCTHTHIRIYKHIYIFSVAEYTGKWPGLVDCCHVHVPARLSDLFDRTRTDETRLDHQTDRTPQARQTRQTHLASQTHRTRPIRRSSPTRPDQAIGKHRMPVAEEVLRQQPCQRQRQLRRRRQRRRLRQRQALDQFLLCKMTQKVYVSRL